MTVTECDKEQRHIVTICLGVDDSAIQIVDCQRCGEPVRIMFASKIVVGHGLQFDMTQLLQSESPRPVVRAMSWQQLRYCKVCTREDGSRVLEKDCRC